MRQKWAFFSFKGRMRRREYWLYSLPVLLVAMPILMMPMDAELSAIQEGFAILILGFVMWSSLALNIKRLHDRGKGAGWIILTFVPLVGPLFVLVELGILAGTKGDNRFGSDPKQQSSEPPSSDNDSSDVTIEM